MSAVIIDLQEAKLSAIWAGLEEGFGFKIPKAARRATAREMVRQVKAGQAVVSSDQLAVLKQLAR